MLARPEPPPRGAFFMLRHNYGWRPALPFASNVCYDAFAQSSFTPVAWLRHHDQLAPVAHGSRGFFYVCSPGALICAKLRALCAGGCLRTNHLFAQSFMSKLAPPRRAGPFSWRLFARHTQNERPLYLAVKTGRPRFPRIVLSVGLSGASPFVGSGLTGAGQRVHTKR